MSWTYTNDPVNDPVDEIHFLVGDTDGTDRLLSNEECEYMLVLYPKPTGKPAYLAAAAACDSIASKLARNIQNSIGPLSNSDQQQYEHYLQLAAQLRLAYATNGLGDATQNLRILNVSPVLGGGGRTYLGDDNLRAGGTGRIA